MLVFITPSQMLAPGSLYSAFVNGAKDNAGQSLALQAWTFRTMGLGDTSKITLGSNTGNGISGNNPSAGSKQNTESSIASAAQTNPLSPQAAVQAAAQNKPAAAAQVSAGLTPEDDEEWIPGPQNYKGDWRSKRFPKGWRPEQQSRLTAPQGITALTGQVLRLNGKPLSNVTVRLGDRTAATDGQGQFLVTDIPSGWQTLAVEGSTANRAHAKYGRFDMRVYITAKRTNELTWIVWMPKLDTAHKIQIPSPTTQETILTSPYIPGLELRIPAGTVVRDRSGKIVTELTITPIPVDQPPFPLPQGGFPIYFTAQPNGAYFQTVDGAVQKPVMVRYPNYESTLKPGSSANFWFYDSEQKGWQVYARGRVGLDGMIDMPDDGKHGLYALSQGGHTGGPLPGPPGPPPCTDDCCAGAGGPAGSGSGGGPGSPPGSGGGSGSPGGDSALDPCSISTGQFNNVSTDFLLSDLIPIDIRRVYRQGDTRSLEFGIGATHAFDMYITGYGTTTPIMLTLVMPNGSQINFQNTNGILGHGGEYTNLDTPGEFYKAKATDFVTTTVEGYYIALRDGRVYTFNGLGKLIEIRDRYGNRVTVTRQVDDINIGRITSPSGRWLDFTYDGTRRITKIQDNIGRSTSYVYDASGRLDNMTDLNGGKWFYTYDANHRMLTVKDPSGNIKVTNQYDVNGRVSQQTYADTSTFKLAYTIDTGGKVTQTDITDARGNIRRAEFDSAGYVKRDTLALGTPEQQVYTYTRDPTSNLMQSTTDPLGRITSYVYDSNGNVTTVTRLAGTPDAVSWNYSYEPAYNQIATVTDPLLHTTSFTYDSFGNLTQVTDALGNASTFAYNGAGQVVTLTDALGNATQLSYDFGDLSTVTDPLARTTNLYTDALGRDRYEQVFSGWESVHGGAHGAVQPR